jgi:ligand-binding SRPBCC domain-containing protein
MEFKTIVNKPLSSVKAAFTDLDSALLNRILPFGCGILKFKGIRRRAKISIYTWFFKTYKFKVVMASSTDSQYYFHLINDGDMPFGIKLWTNRYRLLSTERGTEIVNTIEYTTKNSNLDKFLSVFIRMMFSLRKLKYKMFFLFRN